MASSAHSTGASRRAMLAATFGLPLAAALGTPTRAGAAAVGNTFAIEHARYQHARLRFINLPDDVEELQPDVFEAEEDAYLDASRRFEECKPTNWTEYVLFFEAHSDGSPCAREMLALARQLVAREG